MKNRATAERRHKDIVKAIRKKKLSKIIYGEYELYKNLHQYSKNKIHCSCPLCAAKTNSRYFQGSHRLGKKNWDIKDLKKLEALIYSEEEYYL
jgi:hypothetical protein